MIVGDMKIIVECYWRGTKKLDTIQLYNLTADIVSAAGSTGCRSCVCSGRGLHQISTSGSPPAAACNLAARIK
jgi:ribonucleotide reductase alpha subunit